ncbi:hypothetical protein IHV25_03005 [Phaeovibrio sulfidiphilus]|uniref:DUF1499 domain-containing protein n=1 Tax=Phaeovibrio sulfidiphilus TaxID=1220600 RepID=A0A8J6YLJ9_9PROT|nr:hypothetical protein [Phaeovibrio sulfidiphilus]MBE1236620.1 hypothetical protein [Phaeovibrio sulfidiphilus]
MNRLLGFLLTLALLALGAFGYATWSGTPLPTATLYTDEPPALLDDDDWWRPSNDLYSAYAGLPSSRGDRNQIDVRPYPVPPAQLYDMIRGIVLTTPHLRVLRDHPDSGRLDVAIRSPILGIPEFASVQVFRESDTSSSLRMVSRSQEGAWLPGSHYSRLEIWLAELERALRAAREAPADSAPAANGAVSGPGSP